MRRAYNVGCYKIPYAERDVAHAVLTPADDRGFYNIIGADTPDDDDRFPVGAKVTYRVELTEEEAARFRGASNCRYVELDVEAHQAASSAVGIPSMSTLTFMGCDFPRIGERFHGRDVPVAILDSGISAEVITDMGWTLQARTVTTATDPGAGNVNTEHGVWVATAAVPAGGIVLDAVIAEPDGNTLWSVTASAITWAADQGCKIINISYAGSVGSSALTDALDYISPLNCVVFCANGNDSTEVLRYPAAYCTTYDFVHAVINFDTATGVRWSTSNYHTDATGCAPGANVIGLNSDATLVSWSGTSAASPHAASLCARGATGGTYTPKQVSDALKAAMRDTAAASNEEGGGAYDLEAALTSLGAFTSPVAAPQRQNLCSNPSLEVDATGYSAAAVKSGKTTTAVGRSNAIAAAAGTYYGFVNVTGDSAYDSTVDVEITLPTCVVEAGETYEFSAAVRHQAASLYVGWRITWEDSGGSTIYTETDGWKFARTAEWVRHWYQTAAPANAVEAVVKIVLANIVDSTARSFRWDAVMYEQVT